MSKNPVDPFLEFGAVKLDHILNDHRRGSFPTEVKKSEYFGKGRFLVVIREVTDDPDDLLNWYITVVNLSYGGDGELDYDVAWSLFPQCYATQHEAERAFIDCLLSVKESYNG